MKCSALLETLREPAEKALRELGYEFYVTRTADVLEFEVVKPENFIARMTRLRPPNRSFGLTARLTGRSVTPKGGGMSEVEIITFSEVSTASKFVEKMVGYMPNPPWEGLKGSESIRGEWEAWLTH
jgi:hypothetical protein